MKFLFTYSFIRDYRALPDQIQSTVDKKLKLFLNNQRQPIPEYQKNARPPRHLGRQDRQGLSLDLPNGR